MSCLSLLVSLVSPLSIQSKKFHISPLKKSVKNDRVMIATRNLSRSMPSVAVIIKWPTVVIGDRMVSLMVCAVYSYDREDH